MSHNRFDIALEETERRLATHGPGGGDDGWDGKVRLLLASCFPEQRAFVEDPHRRVVALCGRGAGKTTAGRARMMLRMLRTPKAKCLYVASTREAAEKLMWAAIKDIADRIGLQVGKDIEYNESKLRATLKRNGSTLWLFGADSKKDIDKLRGLPFHEVGIDEGASYSTDLLDHLITRVIAPRLGDYKGVMWLIGTPGHVLKGIFYEATRPGSPMHRPFAERDNGDYAGWVRWSSHQWTLESGAQHVPEMANQWSEAIIEKEHNGWTDDNPVWLREWRGQWAADDTEAVYKYHAHKSGQPWNQWDPARAGELRMAVLPEEFRDWCHVIGMDLGRTDPFALNVFAFSPSDPTRTIYHRFGYEKKGMYAQPIAQLLIGEALKHEDPDGVIGAVGTWPDAMVADSAHLGELILDELSKVYGVRIEPATKGDRYKFGAIEVVNGDLVDGRLKILKGSQLESQLLALQWHSDEFGRLKERKDQANHSTDSLIYARSEIQRLISAGYVAPVSNPRHDPRAEPDDETTRGDYDDVLADIGDYDSILAG